MADDIIPLRRSYVLSMVERITDLEAEIERLRAREQDLRMYAEQDACEIERLRAAGDALAKSLAEFNDPEDEMRLLTWREVRRG